MSVSAAAKPFAAPALSHLVSGMPYPPMIPPMTIELATYGFLAGALREERRWNPFLAIAAALIGGRIVFLLVAVATGAAGPSLPGYLRAALLPGVAAAVGRTFGTQPRLALELQLHWMPGVELGGEWHAPLRLGLAW